MVDWGADGSVVGVAVGDGGDSYCCDSYGYGDDECCNYQPVTVPPGFWFMRGPSPFIYGYLWFGSNKRDVVLTGMFGSPGGLEIRILIFSGFFLSVLSGGRLLREML